METVGRNLLWPISAPTFILDFHPHRGKEYPKCVETEGTLITKLDVS